MYAELHAHSAFSFLDGASLPDELAGAAAELGYAAFALTDHNGLSGSMEFAQAAKEVGRQGDPRRGGRPRRRAPPRAAGRHAGGLAQPVPHPHARARARARSGRAAARRAAGDDRGACRRARVPQRLRAPGRARRADAAPAAAPPSGAESLLRRAAAALPARRPRAQPAAGGAGASGSGSPPWPRATSTRTRRARAAAGRLRGAAQPHDARRVRAAAARQHVARARLAGGDGRALRGPPARGGRGRGAGRAAALRPDRRPRLPLSGVGGPGGEPRAGRAVLGAAGRALSAAAARTTPPPTRGWRRSCG